MSYQSIKGRLDAEAEVEAKRRRKVKIYVAVAALIIGVALYFSWGTTQQLVCDPVVSGKNTLTEFGRCRNIAAD